MQGACRGQEKRRGVRGLKQNKDKGADIAAAAAAQLTSLDDANDAKLARASLVRLFWLEQAERARGKHSSPNELARNFARYLCFLFLAAHMCFAPAKAGPLSASFYLSAARRFGRPGRQQMGERK